MDNDDTVVAVFGDHEIAGSCQPKPADAGIEIKHLSVIGKGDHIDAKVVGSWSVADRVKLRARRVFGRPLGWLGGRS